ncbi:hypothetical protein N0V82_006750 [Gnomoniopsis sp. IMI 355080]|nr:hypothetical protein N0V82_006750 [Gnomoniopsis sp. IMI 355080]
MYLNLLADDPSPKDHQIDKLHFLLTLRISAAALSNIRATTYPPIFPPVFPPHSTPLTHLLAAIPHIFYQKKKEKTMWKVTVPTLLAAVASLASAQEYDTSEPFTLKLISKANSTINGQFLASCHAGAAIEELCLAGTDGTPDDSNTYNLNITTSADSSDQEFDTGILTWLLQGSGFNVSEGLVFSPSLTSNVVAPEFEPAESYAFQVGFDCEDRLFIYSSIYDEACFTAGEVPTAVTPVPLYQWYACYTYNGGYYYHVLAWVTEGEPINPTCEAVEVKRVFI